VTISGAEALRFGLTIWREEGKLAVTGPPEDNQMPPITGPGQEGAPGKSDAVPEVEGYEILALLGHGGMGTVWSAVQLSTRRAHERRGVSVRKGSRPL
jgi:hypothetical protein